MDPTDDAFADVVSDRRLPANLPPPRHCLNCRAPTNNRCGRCHLVWFCGPACQLAAAPDHKELCRTVISTRGAAKPYQLSEVPIMYISGGRGRPDSIIQACTLISLFAATSKSSNAELPSAALLLRGGVIDPSGPRLEVGVVRPGTMSRDGSPHIIGKAFLLRSACQELLADGWEVILARKRPPPLIHVELLGFLLEGCGQDDDEYFVYDTYKRAAPAAPTSSCTFFFSSLG